MWQLLSRVLVQYLVLVPLAIGVPDPAGDTVAADSELSRFERTLRYLQGAEYDIRSEFAILAIDRLQHVYTAEAELARDQYARTGDDPELIGWALAVESYAAQMPELAAEVGQGATVLISGGGVQGLTLQVNGRMVLLVHPRPNQQDAFERDLLHLFCAQQPCEDFTPGAQPAAPIPVSRAMVEPDWRFTDLGAVCAHGGIEIVFAQRGNLSSVRRLCRQLLHELLTLSDEIAWQARYSVTIDWQRLSITATVRRPEHRVQLNAAGDSVLIVAPILHSSPGLLAQVAPWLRARQSGDQAALVLDAEFYGWR